MYTFTCQISSHLRWWFLLVGNVCLLIINSLTHENILESKVDWQYGL